MKILIFIFSIILIGFIVVQLFALNSQRDIETYEYVVNKKYDTFELRSYEATLFTSVKLSTKGYNNSSSRGFSILADYIFGGNEKNQKISMTSPVTMSLEDSMTMMFMVPKELEKDKLPKPNSSEIEFKEEPAKKVAAITFGGWADSEKIASYKQKLITSLDKEKVAYTTKFFFLGYNAPYEMTNRKNEVIVELQ